MKVSVELLDPNRFSAAHNAGLRVFPLRECDKRPLSLWKNYQNGSASREEISSWDASNYNVGIVTGYASGVLVLDIDSAEAAAFTQTLDLPLTATVRTGRGSHMYFRYPGFDVRNAVSIKGHKLDFRGDGGYVVGAGSIHPTGAKYEWVHHPEEVGFAELPSSLLDLLKPESRTLRAPTKSQDAVAVQGPFAAFLRDALDDAKADLAGAQEGGRNNALFLAGVKLARHVAGASADWEPFAAELAKNALSIGLDGGEIEATLASCWSAGSAEPTGWMITAREWIYLGKQDVFYHPASGQFLKREGFNNTFAYQHVGRGGVRFFLDRATVYHDRP